MDAKSDDNNEIIERANEEITSPTRSEDILSSNEDQDEIFSDCDGNCRLELAVRKAKYWRQIKMCIEVILRLKEFCRFLEGNFNVIETRMKCDSLLCAVISQQLENVCETNSDENCSDVDMEEVELWVVNEIEGIQKSILGGEKIDETDEITE